jgi:hypothetical protein
MQGLRIRFSNAPALQIPLPRKVTHLREVAVAQIISWLAFVAMLSVLVGNL